MNTLNQLFLFLFVVGICQAQHINPDIEIGNDTIKSDTITSKLDSYNDSYFLLKEINVGIPKHLISGNLQTPFKSLRFFERNVVQGNYELAAGALNFNLIPKDERTKDKDLYVKKLYHVLNDKGLLDYSDIPNRADGLIEPPIGGATVMEGTSRKAILLGKLRYKNKNIPIYLERVKVDNEPPIWVFSAETVEYINPLYDFYKPSELESSLPDFLKFKVSNIQLWEVLALLIAIAIAYLISYIFTKVIESIVNHFTKKDVDDETNKNKFDNIDINPVVYFIRVITVPFAFFLVSTFLFLEAQNVINVLGNTTNSFIYTISIGFALCTAWFTIRLVEFISNSYVHFKITTIDKEGDTSVQRLNKRKTNIAIGAKVIKALIFITALIYIASLYMDITGIGRIFLTSAGIVGVILGFAAQSVIGNFIAGIQVAITKPVKIGDTVIIDNEWCTVEDLRYTYAVIQTWDNRRLITPMKYLITEIIENWSHSELITSSGVFLYVDYTADVDKIREHFIKTVKAHRLWNDDEEPELIVFATDNETFTLRGKISSDTPGHAWKMECEIREQMLAYLGSVQDTLPKERIIVSKNKTNF